MPLLVPILTNDSVSNYTPPAGFAVLFVTEVNGSVVIKCKKSNGSIVDIGCSTGVVPEQSYVDPTDNKLLVSPTAYVDQQSANTLVFEGSTLEDNILTIL